MEGGTSLGMVARGAATPVTSGRGVQSTVLVCGKQAHARGHCALAASGKHARTDSSTSSSISVVVVYVVVQFVCRFLRGGVTKIKTRLYGKFYS